MSSARGTPEAFAAAWRPSSRYTDVRWPIYHTVLVGHILHVQMYHNEGFARQSRTAVPPGAAAPMGLGAC
jgi:hypothetical protein